MEPLLLEARRREIFPGPKQNRMYPTNFILYLFWYGYVDSFCHHTNCISYLDLQATKDMNFLDMFGLPCGMVYIIYCL